MPQITSMRITVDIDESMLEEVMKYTGETKKGPAVVKAASEFVRRQMAREFGRKVMEGEFGDYPMTNDEIESFDR
jgi:Arc/MetJ family transcription regulator